MLNIVSAAANGHLCNLLAAAKGVCKNLHEKFRSVLWLEGDLLLGTLRTFYWVR